MIDELQLFRGKDYAINDKISIRQPTLDEICDYGEQMYYAMVSVLTATPTDYKVWLFDMGYDWTQINDLDLFYTVTRGLDVTQTEILFGNLDLSKFEIDINSQNNEKILYDIENDITIDNVVYELMIKHIRTMHGFKKNVQKAGNDHTKKYLIEKDRRRMERQNNKAHKSILIPLISSMINCEQFKYNHTTVWDLPIYVFNDSVQRIQKLKNYTQIMQGVYAGTIDTKGIDMENINWLGEIVY